MGMSYKLVCFCYEKLGGVCYHKDSVTCCNDCQNFCCNFRCDFLLLMDVNEWMSYECSDEGACTQSIPNSSTRSHTSEEENRTKIAAKIEIFAAILGAIFFFWCMWTSGWVRNV